MYVTAYNTTPGPITVDGEGRVVHGGDYGTVDTTFEQVREALDAGRLVQTELPEGSEASEAAKAAVARTETITGRADELANVHDKDVLAAAAAEAGVVGAGDLSISDLRAALAVRTDVPVPAAPPEKAPDKTSRRAAAADQAKE